MLENTYINSYLGCIGCDNKVRDFIMAQITKNYCEGCNVEQYIKNKYFNNK